MVKIPNDDDGETVKSVVWQKQYDDLESSNKNNNCDDSMGDVLHLKMILAKKIGKLEKIAKSDAKKGLIHRRFEKKLFPESLEQLKNSVRTTTDI